VLRAAYSLWHRGPAATLLPVLEDLGIGLVASSPLGRGAVAGAATDDLLAPLAALAARKHATLAQLALAWLLAQQPWIVPVPGARGFGHADENIGGADLRLTADDLRDIAAVLAAAPVPTPRGMAQALDFTH
jgi:aryl-alcohol dehydrogenase-like predicted oxidoreductase